MAAELRENPFGQPEGEAFRVSGGHRGDRLACFGRDKLSPFLLLLRWNRLPAKNGAHPAIDVAGAGDGTAGGYIQEVLASRVSRPTITITSGVHFQGDNQMPRNQLELMLVP